MVKEPLRGFNIAITGEFGERRTSDKMKQWIQRNGGKFANEISFKVTHLICSKAHFKKQVAMVQQARKFRTIRIVSFDWLEDSLLRMKPKNEREYLMEPRAQSAAETKAKKKVIRKKNIAKGMEDFERSCKEFETDMFSNGYGIYQDSTRFAYDITLARANLLTNNNERYALKVCFPPHNPPQAPPHNRIIDPNPDLAHRPMISTPIFPMFLPSPRARARIVTPRAQRLQLYVSHATPKYFSCNVKYSSPGTAPTSKVLAPIGSTWETAWGAFEMFFKLKTKKDWDMRFIKCDLGTEAFGYTPPKEGEPRGMFLEI